MADEKLFGTLGAWGNCTRSRLFRFFFILSHVCCLMGVFIFQGKEIFLAMGVLWFALCMFVGGCFMEDEDRSHQDPDILMPFLFCDLFKVSRA